ncbi:MULTISPECIES: DEAD/DEAH box helicase [unclassified Modestobacter]|uniref:DEAD/DEAH box helicase n=1 Tax=unclassified Modestobacter TaxID=2643866 RepID=UPI0022AB467E|nr:MULTISPECIES: DEAD/DEAH box helicase [unclassified Modestobacter]MCZ2826034.1 DEAD/DEAH box helicase family protein [Modestobacter sp. VKM Ac-2981]MCZ2852901.1 DEAD/DEAH box helicase family protein [Modestobacter sp. VKM Ac-2982]
MTNTSVPTNVDPELSETALDVNACIQLRPHQLAAISAATKTLSHHDRGQLHMACGTGKTLTALRLAEALETELVLVLVPSLSLLAQTLREWRQHSLSWFSAIAVCSDDTVTDVETSVSVADIPAPVSTQPEVVAGHLTSRRRGGRTVVFATYHSAAVVAEAQAMGAPTFDLALADEAHRTAGHAAPAFQLILDADRIRARKRVFMTATPRLTRARSATSMDDETLYGPVMFRFNFAQAIEAGLLCDYQVVVVGVTDESIRQQLEEGAELFVGNHVLTGREAAASVAVLKAMEDYGITRMVTFHGDVSRAERFATALPGIASALLSPERAVQLSTGHVNGGMSAGERTALLDSLRTLPSGHRRVLTNARCLTEGVDVPAIDGVAFIDPRSSYVDIVQAVGRVLRTAPGKTIGTILLPVYLSAAEDPETVLSSSAFEDVCTVLQALRDHDPAFGAALDAARGQVGTRTMMPSLPGKVIADLPDRLDSDFHTALCTRLLAQTTRPFWEKLQLLADYITAHGDLPRPSASRELHQFIKTQRNRRNHGYMSPEDIAALESLPGWLWQSPRISGELRSRARAMHDSGMSLRAIANHFATEGVESASGPITWSSSAIRTMLSTNAERVAIASSREERWERRYTELKEWTDAFGPLKSRNVGLDPALRSWIMNQKAYYRAGARAMTPQMVTRLEALPGWFWEYARPVRRDRQAA